MASISASFDRSLHFWIVSSLSFLTVIAMLEVIDYFLFYFFQGLPLLFNDLAVVLYESSREIERGSMKDVSLLLFYLVIGTVDMGLNP